MKRVGEWEAQGGPQPRQGMEVTTAHKQSSQTARGTPRQDSCRKLGETAHPRHVNGKPETVSRSILPDPGAAEGGRQSLARGTSNSVRKGLRPVVDFSGIISFLLDALLEACRDTVMAPCRVTTFFCCCSAASLQAPVACCGVAWLISEPGLHPVPSSSQSLQSFKPLGRHPMLRDT